MLALVAVSAAGCSSGGSSAGAGSACEQGSWVSTSMLAPAQAGVGTVTPTGGGGGIVFTFAAGGRFQVDFGPMKPATGTFDSGGQTATQQTSMSGVGSGTWKAGSATIDDLATVRATATLTLGETVPPVFDDTWKDLNTTMMLGQLMGTLTVTSCNGGAMTLTSPFPAGPITIQAKRK